MEELNWKVSLHELRDATERAHAAVWDIRQWAEGHFGKIPEALESHLSVLDRNISTSRDLGNAVSDPLGVAAQKLFAGRLLSREEYYLCRAVGWDFGGAQELGLFDLSDYDVHRFLCYEDDRSYAYINIHRLPQDERRARLRRTGKTGMYYGRAPEDCHCRHLRPEQLTFFRDRLPEVFKRFPND